MARLFPLVAEQAHAGVLPGRAPSDTRSPGKLCGGDLGLPGAVGAHQAQVLAGHQRAVLEEHRVAGRHRHHDVRRERLLE